MYAQYMTGWYFFVKQKTAYEMRISDWSSDVCSSDLQLGPVALGHAAGHDEASAVLLRVGHRQDHIDRLLAGVLDERTRVDDHQIGVEIGRASCRERVCQYV